MLLSVPRRFQQGPGFRRAILGWAGIGMIVGSMYSPEVIETGVGSNLQVVGLNPRPGRRKPCAMTAYVLAGVQFT